MSPASRNGTYSGQELHLPVPRQRGGGGVLRGLLLRVRPKEHVHERRDHPPRVPHDVGQSGAVQEFRVGHVASYDVLFRQRVPSHPPILHGRTRQQEQK